MRVPIGLRKDNPAEPLLQGLVAYWGVTSANGNALGTTLVCADLDNHPTYVGNTIKILTGGASGQGREIAVHAAGGILTVTNPFTDAAGAAQQIVGGTGFVILTSLGGGGVAPGPPPPSVGLWMFGVCDPGMAASTTIVTCPNLAGMPDDIFNDDFYMEVIRNDDNVGFAPEHEIRLITDYVGATGQFTTNAFTANVEANDLVAVIHHSLVGPQLNLISTLARATFDLMNASLVTSETGGLITTDGTEQMLYEVFYPMSAFEPLILNIDMTAQVAGTTVVLRVYNRILAVVPGGGAYVLRDEQVFANAQYPPLRSIALTPNRHGIMVSIQMIAGVATDYEWQVLYRG